MNKFDYIIVGNGLAANCLIWNLLEAGKSVYQVYDPSKKSASSVAAGMFNPLVFKRITRSWRIDELLPVMLAFYSQVEERSGLKFLHKRDIIKLLVEDEYERWKLKTESGEFIRYIVELSREIPFQGVRDFAAYAKITKAGYIDIPTFVKAVNSRSGEE